MEAFVATIIKALPNAVLDAFVTIVFSGILLFVFQERIKTSLAKSLSEHQTKFAQTYPKTLEVLETYTQKMYKASRLIADFIIEFEPNSAENEAVDLVELNEKQEELSKIQIEFSNTSDDAARYLRSNRLYLFNKVLAEVDEIWTRESKMSIVLQLCMQHPNEPIKYVFPFWSFWIYPESVEGVSNEMRSALIVGKLHENYEELVRELEKLYKSVAEPK